MFEVKLNIKLEHSKHKINFYFLHFLERLKIFHTIFFKYFCAWNSLWYVEFSFTAMMLTLKKLQITPDSKDQKKDAQPELKTFDR